MWTVSDDTSNAELVSLVLPLLLDVAKFYTSGDERAKRARRTINKKQDRTKPFHASIWVDLILLHGTLANYTTSQLDSSREQSEPLQQLLEIIDEDFVKTSDVASVTSESSIANDAEKYPRLRQLFGLLQANPISWSAEERIDWLCNHIDLKRPKILAQDRITAQVRCCYRSALKAKSDSRKVLRGAEVQKDQARLPVWHGAEAYCKSMEQLHDKLMANWVCNCQPSHADAKFAFEVSLNTAQQAGHCSMVYQSCVYPHQWRHVTIEMDGTSGGSTALHDKSALCRDLENLQHPTAKVSALERPATYVVTHYGSCGEPLPLDYRLEPEKLASLATLAKKERLLLALYLSYLFLHLGGGPWWPYNRVDRAVWLWGTDKISALSMIFTPLFSASLQVHEPSPKAPATLRGMNFRMPSLPSFGKLLLSIALGREVKWDDIDQAMEDYARDEAFAEEVISAVEACLGTDDLTFKTGGSIREEESMRVAYMSRVVMKLQHILTVGYKVDITEVMRKAASVVTSSSKDLPVATETRDDEAVHLTDPKPSLQCLHQDGDEEMVELLSEQDARSASQWFADLTNSVRQSVQRSLPSQDEDSTFPTVSPVKIAIIDTGVSIDESILDQEFDGRLRECRSWLKDGDGEDGAVISPNSDAVGHGTHATSLVLQATEHTGCEVYVAQVFNSRGDQQKDQTRQATQVAIARAIRYAATKWQVDVISMSFGYQSIVPRIDAAINDHASNVLMFAAASNCGGNAPISWPARHDNVICVFATDAEGNAYPKNPTPRDDSKNFAVLGSSIQGYWPSHLVVGSDHRQHKSGTSCAAPIAAGIAGVMIDLMRRQKEQYLLRYRSHSKQRQIRERDDYEQNLRTLGRPWGMKAVLGLMAKKRQGYDYVVPWQLLHRDDEDMYVVKHLLNTLRDQ
ncbi:hypothetical protein LTR62_006045 [Meristemomyces frigidus]|uniref:Peptidase S8/S53 domain-containing protein n=1 Tax=Meristemomyces frigidus TaxID=1508187 RepID=A0AAN7YEV1_9PEZI|nr:hypothetical protein LTR62_006045 [Meristemomyces frigidus]